MHHDPTDNRKLLKKVLVLTSGFMVIEIVAAFWTNSLALLADAGHMLADVVGLFLAFFVSWLMVRHATVKRTYGWYRAEALGAVLTAMVMLGMSGFILFEAWQRFFLTPKILTSPMIVVASVGLMINLVSLRMVRGKKELYMRAAAFEVLADTLTSVAVIAAGLVIIFTGFSLIDPVISILIGLAILPRVWRLLKEAVDVLLEAVPAHINPLQVRREVLSIKGVKEIHDLHIWQIGTGFTALTCHVLGKANLVDIKERLHEKFHIWHSTVQVEPHRLRERYIGRRWRYRRAKRRFLSSRK